jgi:hypothetical protein
VTPPRSAPGWLLSRWKGQGANDSNFLRDLSPSKGRAAEDRSESHASGRLVRPLFGREGQVGNQRLKQRPGIGVTALIRLPKQPANDEPPSRSNRSVLPLLFRHADESAAEALGDAGISSLVRSLILHPDQGRSRAA